MTDRAPFFYNNGSFWFNETETTTEQSNLSDYSTVTSFAQLNDTFVTTESITVTSDPGISETTQRIESSSVGRIFFIFSGH